MITLEMFITVVSAALVVAGIYFGLKSMLNRIIEQNDELLHMHKNPENTGFGTIGFMEAFEDNTRVLKQLIHYLKWSIKKQSGSEPPPYVED